MNRSCALVAALALVVSCLAVPSTARAALIEIWVEGTWTATHPDPNRNPFGLVAGNTFLMHAVYDDTSLFFRADAFSGVVASLDPGINPGTFLEITIPHFDGAPNPITFTQADHIDIGFAPTAEIHFDGPSVANPGNFRNFEIHTEFNFFNPNNSVNQSMHFDTFFGGVAPESDIFNITESGAIAATGTGAHLQVIPAPLPEPSAGALLLGSLVLVSLTTARVRRAS